MKPIIDAHIICWNESRLIRHTLKHYSSFCRNITLFDNNSTDDTVKIVKREFPAVKVVTFSSEDTLNESALLNVKNNCWKDSMADYVIVCDTDEFLFAENMEEKLMELKNKKVTIPVITGYNMQSETFPDNYDIPIFEQVRTGARERSFDKQIIFNPNRLIEINYDPGCHGCSPVYKEDALLDEVVQFNLLHYKYLSREYLYKRHAAYVERMSDFNKEKGFAIEYHLGKEHVDKCFEQLYKHVYNVLA